MGSVLLVDDDSSILLTLSIALRRRGHEVTVACDAFQALRQLQRRHFKVMVSDIRMPGMSGLELAARVRNSKDAPRIILTSAHYDPFQEPNLASFLAERFIAKPLDAKLLCGAVDEEMNIQRAGIATLVT